MCIPSLQRIVTVVFNWAFLGVATGSCQHQSTREFLQVLCFPAPKTQADCSHKAFVTLIHSTLWLSTKMPAMHSCAVRCIPKEEHNGICPGMETNWGCEEAFIVLEPNEKVYLLHLFFSRMMQYVYQEIHGMAHSLHLLLPPTNDIARKRKKGEETDEWIKKKEEEIEKIEQGIMLWALKLVSTDFSFLLSRFMMSIMMNSEHTHTHTHVYRHTCMLTYMHTWSAHRCTHIVASPSRRVIFPCYLTASFCESCGYPISLKTFAKWNSLGQ